jgi:hypothetical protein
MCAAKMPANSPIKKIDIGHFAPSSAIALGSVFGRRHRHPIEVDLTMVTKPVLALPPGLTAAEMKAVLDAACRSRSVFFSMRFVAFRTHGRGGIDATIRDTLQGLTHKVAGS